MTNKPRIKKLGVSKYAIQLPGLVDGYRYYRVGTLNKIWTCFSLDRALDKLREIDTSAAQARPYAIEHTADTADIDWRIKEYTK